MRLYLIVLNIAETKWCYHLLSNENIGNNLNNVIRAVVVDPRLLMLL